MSSASEEVVCIGCGSKPKCFASDCKHCTDQLLAFGRCETRREGGQCNNVVCYDFGCRTNCHDCCNLICTQCFQDGGAACMLCDENLCDNCGDACKECGDCFCAAHAYDQIRSGLCAHCRAVAEKKDSE